MSWLPYALSADHDDLPCPKNALPRRHHQVPVAENDLPWCPKNALPRRHHQVPVAENEMSCGDDQVPAISNLLSAS
jgi:hypothetical protein